MKTIFYILYPITLDENKPSRQDFENLDGKEAQKLAFKTLLDTFGKNGLLVFQMNTTSTQSYFLNARHFAERSNDGCLDLENNFILVLDELTEAEAYNIYNGIYTD